MNPRAWLTPLATVGAVILLAACSSSEKKPAYEEPGRIGEATKSAGITRVPVEEHVVITKSEEIPTITQSFSRADINRMNEDAFVAMGFPKEAAKNIVDFRDEHGPFTRVEELKTIQGVKPDLYAKLQGKLGVSTPAPQG